MRTSGGRVFSPVATLVAPSLLFLAALFVRALPLPSVVTQHFGIQPFGNDAYYHLRRIEYAVANPGQFLGFDRYLNFPEGARAIWSPAFDWVLAQLALLFVPRGDAAAMEELLVWVPPVVGAVTVVLLYFAALRFFTFGTALLAAALLSILPSHFWYSQIGFIDHHVAVAGFAVLLLWSAMALASVEVPNEAPPVGGLRTAAALGVCMGGALLVWPGALLHVACVQLLLGIRTLVPTRPAEAVGRARLLTFAHAIAFFVVVPFYAGNRWELWGDFSPVVGSNFQPMWFMTATLGFAALSELWQRAGESSTRLDRVLSALALAAIVLGIAIWVVPELSRGVVQSWGWFSKDEAFQASVAESAPLFRAPAQRVQELFTRFVYVMPLGLALLVWDRRRSGTPAFWLLLGFATLLFAATVMQRRFMNSASVPYALVLALTLSTCFRVASRVRIVGPALLVAVTAFALWPSFLSYAVDAANFEATLQGRDPYLLQIKRVLLLKSSAAQAIRRLTPDTAGYLDDRKRPEYAVLTPWSDGHVVKYRGRRPVNVDNFGNDVGEANFAAVEQYFSTDSEERALAIAKQLGARYVLIGAVEVRREGGHGLRSMYARLSLPPSGPTRELGSGDAERSIQVSKLVHHRLIWAGVPLDGLPGEERAYYKLYELVEGARIEGRAPPGTLVEARLLLSPEKGGEFLFATSARVGDEGRYALTVPYPSEAFGAEVAVADAYEIISKAGSVHVRVTEEQVQSGATVKAPPFDGLQ